MWQPLVGTLLVGGLAGGERDGRFLPGPVEVPLAVDVCFPDGCRASAPLDAAQMSVLLSAPQADLQFFPFGAEAPVAAAVTLPDLRGSLSGAGVTLGD